MYCSHCGKKVEDRMLFCPFCGEPIVIPEQDDESAPAEETALEQPFLPIADEPGTTDVHEDVSEPAPDVDSDDQPGDAARELLSWNRERRSYAGAEEEPAPEEKQDFRPLDFDDGEDADGGEDWREEIARRKREGAPEKHAPEVNRRDGEPARLDGRAPKLEESAEGASKAHRSAHTYVPPKALDPDDLFMDGKEDKADPYDEYDAYDAPDEYDAYDGGDDDEDEYVYEDEAEGNFFMRHIRGIVGLTLLVVLALMFAIYAASDSGQRSLARANLAWKADVYGALGYQYYNEQRYEQSGLYYERALARKPDNYSYASSAAMAYYTGNNKDKATALLKKCIEIDPSRVEPYIYLLNLYPEAAQRPYDVTRLIQSGYQTTLDSRLKIDQ